MKNFILFICLIITSATASPQTILCFGDSITHKGTWVKQLGQHIDFITINAGKSGRRVSQAVEHLKEILQQHDTDKIIIFLGVNDLPARDKRPGDIKVKNCLDTMSKVIHLARAKFKSKGIVLIAPPTVNPHSMNEMNLKKGYDITPPLLKKLEIGYRKLSIQHGVHFLSLHDIVSANNYSDGLHPNRNGDEEIYLCILNFLKEL